MCGSREMNNKSMFKTCNRTISYLVHPTLFLAKFRYGFARVCVIFFSSSVTRCISFTVIYITRFVFYYLIYLLSSYIYVSRILRHHTLLSTRWRNLTHKKKITELSRRFTCSLTCSNDVTHLHIFTSHGECTTVFLVFLSIKSKQSAS